MPFPFHKSIHPRTIAKALCWDGRGLSRMPSSFITQRRASNTVSFAFSTLRPIRRTPARDCRKKKKIKIGDTTPPHADTDQPQPAALASKHSAESKLILVYESFY